MKSEQAEKQAAKASRTGVSQFVVWVFDEGRQIFDAEQARIWAPLIHVEAIFVNGAKVVADMLLSEFP